jgi:DNA repair protein RadC
MTTQTKTISKPTLPDKISIFSPYVIGDNDLLLDVSPGERRYILKVRDMPEEVDSKPREKLIKQGPEVLSIQELLAVIMITGSTKEDVLALSHRVLREYGEKIILAERNPQKMSEELDIPMVKACQIVAVGELGRRFYEKNSAGFTIIRTAKDVYEYLRDMRHLPKEHLRGLYLDGHSQIIHDEVISIGTINSNIVHPREVFRPAVEYNAVAVILAHNHPSGIVTPSPQDIEITTQLIAAGKIMGIHLLDHVIITEQTFLSVEAAY